MRPYWEIPSEIKPTLTPSFKLDTHSMDADFCSTKHPFFVTFLVFCITPIVQDCRKWWAGGKGGYWPPSRPHVLSDQLTLLHPGVGANYAHHITNFPLIFRPSYGPGYYILFTVNTFDFTSFFSSSSLDHKKSCTELVSKLFIFIPVPKYSSKYSLLKQITLYS